MFLGLNICIQDEQTGRQRRIINQNVKIYQTLIDINQQLPKSTKNLLSIFLRNTLYVFLLTFIQQIIDIFKYRHDQNQCLAELKQKFLTTIKG